MMTVLFFTVSHKGSISIYRLCGIFYLSSDLSQAKFITKHQKMSHYHQYAPFPAKTALKVLNKYIKSIHTDQFRTYQVSIATRSS